MKSLTSNRESFVGQILETGLAIFLLLIFNVQFGLSQTTQLEQAETSYVGNILTGPVSGDVKVKMVNNISTNLFSDYTPEITITASFSDQKFRGFAGVSTMTGNFFGGTASDLSKTATSQKVWRTLNSVSNPSDEMFTSTSSGVKKEGIDINTNYGFNMFTSVEPLYEANNDRSGRYYYSTLTLTFSRAISNPVLHVEGLGAFTKVDNKTLGYSTELELQNTTGLTLSKLSGSDALIITNNKILNGKTLINAESEEGAATGSISVTGNNITTLVFKVYLKGDNNGSSWSAPNFFSGDQWLLSVSMNSASISGNVFDDANGLSGTPVNTVDGLGVNGSDIDSEISGNQTLYANLVNSSKQIVKTAEVGKDGIYIFQDVMPATYSIVLSQDKTSATSILPTGWVNTGENIGVASASGHDGEVNGILTNVSFASANSVIANANFGINKIPVIDAKTQMIAQPGASQILPLDGTKTAPALTAKDYEDGKLGEGSTLIITRLPKRGELLYNGYKVVVNTNIENFISKKLQIRFTSLEDKKIDFDYTFMDKAGKSGVPAKYELTWAGGALPVTLTRFTVEAIESYALLSWTTTSESNSGVFEIEHSTNGKDWNTVGSVDAHGESSESIQYYYTHTKTAAGENLYRLKMIDLDGTFAFSQIKSIRFKQSEGTVIYPNPAVDVVNVKVDGKSDWSNVSKLNIYDIAGNLVLSPELKSDKIDVNALKNGFYIIQVLKSDGAVSSSRMSILK